MSSAAWGTFVNQPSTDETCRKLGLVDVPIEPERPELPHVIDIDEEFNDSSNAKRLLAIHGQEMRYCGEWRKWLVYDGRRWKLDTDCKMDSFAKDVHIRLIDQIARSDEGGKRGRIAKALRLGDKKAIEAMISLARCEVPISHRELDSDPWLLNVKNGTVDLRTGHVRSHTRDDLMTKCADVTYDPDAECERWMAFLDRILDGNQELISYLQRLVGYTLTGTVREHILPIFHGNGANGKTVFFNVVQALLGDDYSMKAPRDMLMARKHSAHPTEQASLFGKRLLAASETEDGHRLNEPLVKELTGGEIITARRMKEDFWTFPPTHKIWMATNHKPEIRGTDDGIWRRVRLIPFAVQIPPHERDPRLTERLIGELSGILNWAMEGCLSWQTQGLQEPAMVMAATESYRNESDELGAFLADATLEGAHYTVKAGDLFEEYQRWGGTLTMTSFGKAMQEKYDRKRLKSGYHYRGIGLIQTTG